MSQTDNDSGHRPQVIDLEAEEIRSDTDTPKANPAAEEPDEPVPPPPPRAGKARRGTATWIIAALVAGAIAGGWFYRGVLSSYLPSNEMTALKNKVAALDQNNATLTEQLTAVTQAVNAAQQAAAAANDQGARAADMAKAAAQQAVDLGDRAGAADEKAGALADQVKALANDLQALRTAMASASSAAPGTTVAASPVDSAALAALTQRVEALEKDVASLKPAAGSSSQAGVTAALSQALSDLKAKIAAGTSYEPEYERVARMVPAAPGLDILAAHAAEGIPDAKGLATELTDAIPSLPAPAAPEPEDNSYFGTVMKSLSGIVTVRPIGETDWRQVAEKAAALATAGDLIQAIGVIEKAEGDKPIPLSQWRDRAAARLALEAATAQVSEAVLRQLAVSGGAAQ